MNLEEYKQWLEENANCEEQKAYEVAQEIIRYHSMYWERGRDLKVELFPRKIIVHEGDRLEFDLIMVFEWQTDVFSHKRTYTRTVGVEFKEIDIRKVIQQAIRRRDFVDYMYIATRNIVLDHFEHILMAEFGIGNFGRFYSRGRCQMKKPHPGEFVLKYEDAEKLLDMAILKTVDVMRRESNDRNVLRFRH